MRILCLLDILDYNNRNNFPIDFVNSLQANKQIEQIDYGIKWLELDIPVWDIVHIHWPEDLLKGKFLNKKNVRALHDKLTSWSNYTTIIYTVHDTESYYSQSAIKGMLYDGILANAHGFVHMGKPSVDLFNAIHKNKYGAVPYTIIPHGNYRAIGLLPDKQAARKGLKIAADEIVILVIGKIRGKEELDLLLKPIKSLSDHKVRIYFLGHLPTIRSFFKDLDLKMILSSLVNNIYWRLLIYFAKNVHAKIGRHDNKVLLDHVAAADILFIARRKILNSGNVPLGFTFGKIVFGPNWGDVGELLTAFKNPVFEVDDPPRVVGEKLISALNLTGSNLGEKNQIVARDEWDWAKIATLHIQFYEHLINKH